MSRSESSSTRHEIRIDLQGLIRLLAKNLYAEADVFVREMIQNAHDSIKRREESEGQDAQAGVIRIRTDAGARTISITDNGSGLTETEIHDYLATIGRSGTGEFRQQLLKQGRGAEVTLIGQFGIGLLSAFVVAYRVEVETLSIAPGHPSWLWVSEGQSEYELRRGTRTDPGTTVTLYVSDQYLDMLNPNDLRRAIKKYADFIPYPIYLHNEGASTNVVNAPWHRTFPSERERTQEYWNFVSQRFPDYPLEVIPVDLEQPYRAQGVLYISDQHIPDVNTTGMVDIYQTRMFITGNNRDMLPSWAKFVRGVIDSPDLTPTASRDAIQPDAVAHDMKEALGQVIIRHLQELAVRDAVRFERIMEWHWYHVKGMAVAHDAFFDAIADLVPFETNRGLMNLRKYLQLSASIGSRTGNDIFYLSERGSATQFYMLCDAKGLLVVNAGYIFEENFLRKYAERHPQVRLHQISVAGSEFLFEPLSPEGAAEFRQLELDFQRNLPDPRSQVRVARFQPPVLPAVTVLTADAKLREELEETRRSLILPESVRDLAGRLLEERPTVPIILYLNAENATIQQMARMAQSPIVDPEAYRAATVAIGNNAILLAQHLLTPRNVQDLFTSSTQTITLLIKQTERLSDLQARLSTSELLLHEKEQAAAAQAEDTALSTHTRCMVALPFKDSNTFAYETVLLPALREVLEQKPYYWEVVRADAKYYENTIEGNVTAWMQRSHAYIADISDLNPNVMMEVGFMRWSEPARTRPLIVLQRDGTGTHLADLAGVIRIAYPNATGKDAVREIAEALRQEFAKKTDVEQLNARKQAHYLSSLVLINEFGVARSIAEDLMRAFGTMEALIAAPVEEILRRVTALRSGVASGLQRDITALLNELRPMP